MSNHIVLYQPEIPANTGNIARTCVGTGTHLHLIRPLGFSTDDKMLKRAGCDYWPNVDIHYYDSLEELFKTWPEGEYFFVETIGSTPYSDFSYNELSKDYFFVFGSETKGLPEEITFNNKDHCLRIPQNDYVRSLNLSNTAAIVIYEVLRQQQFPQLY
ncbi:tRNA (uridine(34)/cytosine(34)/5-carboxymethylaminomethyluridine(34)-2'-O)-methyltransferase TrmL [Salibacterium salarium]|uniref:Putative tRNA (cytidine(34)-2'-O)-methyltransferase n=1 Tax=Salibacterium salarium TaxID=284579 RepID=A0A428N7G8_9BACI|nr:tRNA (uridine(34)/cytosine(34)/5-carboxymethylaminomethyluridine(34)-2'-O)-methyltransferase TrmL [Salibacterium salarium]RSL34332.1 tRNA (uridine(34)/cytosine(34)/5-carboxymethylaminomethyluridine(34)-2'-O)-methyltransferase TrmL [Salibacterium salarium]